MFKAIAFRGEKKEKGFTLIELLIVIAIIGILAMIAIPQFAAYRERGYRATLNSDLKNAFTAAQAYLADHPGGTVDTEQKLLDYGYKKSTGIVFSAANITATSGSIRLYHDALGATKIGTVNHDGTITMP